jgi:hypothetical protein
MITNPRDVIRVVAAAHGVTFDPFDVFYSDAYIAGTVEQAERYAAERPYWKIGQPRTALDVFIRLVESDLGIDPGEPREAAEYQRYMSE